MKRIAILIVSVLVYSHLLSQIGGTRTYRFLDIPMTARAAALGGNSMSIWGNDVNLMYSNPAALNSTMSKQIALNYCNYVGDMNFGYLAYAHDLKKYGTVGGGIQFLDYGSFKGYDEFGEATKDFKANDYSINLNYAKPFEDSTFQIGIALKTLISQYDIYQSYGNAIDFGITYHTSKNFVFTVLAKNVGFIWKDYSANRQTREVLPQTVQLGMSYKVSKAPFRLIAVYDNLLKWNLKYISPLDTAGQTNPFDTDKDVADSTKWQRFTKKFGTGTDNFFRHLTLGTEIVLHENFMLRIAYNHRRQREMLLPERRGANGLSVGFGLKIKRFGFGFSFTKMASAGNSVMLNVNYHL